MPVFTISIGNITLGGTGKTPFCVFLGNYLSKKGKRVGIVTKGYKKKSSTQVFLTGNEEVELVGDEPLLIKKKLPFINVVSTKNLIDGGRKLVKLFDSNVLILDDAFQFRSIYKDINFLIIDLINPFGFGRLIPAGLLRESIGSIKNADIVLFSRCECVGDSVINNLKNEINKIKKDVPIILLYTKPKLIEFFNENSKCSPNILSNKKVVTVCGIGNPEEFEIMISNYAYDIYSFRYTDHYKYTNDDIEHIENFAKEKKADYIITTYKDFFRLPKQYNYSCKWGVLDIEIEVREGKEILYDSLRF